MSGVLCPQGGNLPTLTGSATVTVGLRTIPASPDIIYWGKVFTFAGSVAPTTWGSSGATLSALCWVDAGVPGAVFSFMAVVGYVPNSGWTTYTVAGTPFNRADASYSFDAINNQTTWSWNPSSNPYGTTIGATKAVSWS